jgi:hypothetical protein
MRDGVGFGRSPKAASKKGPLCEAIGARQCVSANDGNLLLVIAPHAVFRDEEGWLLAGAVVEENGAAIEPPRWATLTVEDLSYIMPTRQPFEPHPDYDPKDPRFAGDAGCRLSGEGLQQ